MGQPRKSPAHWESASKVLVLRARRREVILVLGPNWSYPPPVTAGGGRPHWECKGAADSYGVEIGNLANLAQFDDYLHSAYLLTDGGRA